MVNILVDVGEVVEILFEAVAVVVVVVEFVVGGMVKFIVDTWVVVVIHNGVVVIGIEVEQDFEALFMIILC